MITYILRLITFSTIAILFFSNSYGQKTKVLGHVFYGGVSYQYNEDDYLRQIIKTSSIPAYGIQSSIRLVLSKGFQIGSGLNYIITKGKTDPIFVDKGLSNSNTTGNFTLEVNSSYFQVPVEFIVSLSQKWKIKPFLAAGLNLYIPLKQYYFAKISPVSPNTFYARVEHTINKGTEYRGFFIGSGVALPLNEKRDLEIRLSYRTNNFQYKSPVLGTGVATESRAMKFNILEFSLGFGIF